MIGNANNIFEIKINDSTNNAEAFGHDQTLFIKNQVTELFENLVP